jgi:fumarylpyruvate hydrolase
VELVAAIGRGGTDIQVESALDHVFGYAVGIDLTKRDRQNEAKAAAQPWERSKAFDQSAPLSPILPLAANHAPIAGRISLAVNGAVRQEADLASMIWSVAEIVARASQIWMLAPGDLIFTGTPEGVGPVAFGDVLEARIENVGGLRVEIGSGA